MEVRRIRKKALGSQVTAIRQVKKTCSDPCLRTRVWLHKPTLAGYVPKLSLTIFAAQKNSYSPFYCHVIITLGLSVMDYTEYK